MAATLAEPAVLAAAKETLYPDLAHAPDQYAVTETQFTVDTWGDWEIPDGVKDRLAPFNAVRLASGEPDLLGVGMPATEVLNGEGTSTPVVVVEAKGDTSGAGDAAVRRGIEQAHSHLPEVNLGYVAAPVDSVTETALSLARQLNVGVVGVHDLETAELLEPARVTGAWRSYSAPSRRGRPAPGFRRPSLTPGRGRRRLRRRAARGSWDRTAP